jgi:hypothetical protein
MPYTILQKILNLVRLPVSPHPHDAPERVRHAWPAWQAGRRSGPLSSPIAVRSRDAIISFNPREQLPARPVIQMSAVVQQRPGFTPAQAMPPPTDAWAGVSPPEIDTERSGLGRVCV